MSAKRTYVFLPLAVEKLRAYVCDEGPRVGAQRVEADVLATGAKGGLFPQPLVGIPHDGKLGMRPRGDAAVFLVAEGERECDA